MKAVDFTFDGCNCYESADKYRFTQKFEEWWSRELRKRIKSFDSFIKQHGKGWYLSFSFGAQKSTRKAETFGPAIQRNCISDPPHHRGWHIALPSFRYQSPDSKAYIPLMRQFLEQFAVVLELEGIDASEIGKDSPLLLKRFGAQSGMVEYDDLGDFIAAEQKKERDRAKDSAKSLKADREISERLKNLRRKYKLRFGVAFDATAKQRRGKGWLTDYAVIDLTVALPSKRGEIADNLYREAIHVFRRSEEVLQRSRVYYCLRIVPDLKKQPWSVVLFFTNGNSSGEQENVRSVATEFLSLMVGHKVFKHEYAGFMHALCGYARKDRCLFAFPSQVPITFSDHFKDSDSVEKVLLLGRCDKNITGMSGVYLGNSAFWHGRLREAIKHWHQGVNAGVTEALFNIACGYTALGDMQRAFQFCKRAILKGAPRNRLNDPDLAAFRRHPLFAKLKMVREAKPAKLTKPLSPKWNMPKNVKELVEENDGMWDDERWKPILIRVVSGTSSRRRKQPLCWQIEFDPYVRPFKAAGKQITQMGGDADGDGWTELIEREFKQRYPKLTREFDSDSEMATCVVSVKSEQACKKLLELIWSLIYPK